MKFFSLAILLAMTIAFFSCSNGPMLESDLFRQGNEEELYKAAPPPNTDISSDEVELYCKDMSFEESLECVASLNDKKQEDFKTWQVKQKEPPKQVKKPAQKKQTKQPKKSTQKKQNKPKK
jgi:hypothetical protein